MSNGHCYGSPSGNACGVKQKRIQHPAAREAQIRHLQKRFGLANGLRLVTVAPVTAGAGGLSSRIASPQRKQNRNIQS